MEKNSKEEDSTSYGEKSHNKGFFRRQLYNFVTPIVYEYIKYDPAFAFEPKQCPFQIHLSFLADGTVRNDLTLDKCVFTYNKVGATVETPTFYSRNLPL